MTKKFTNKQIAEAEITTPEAAVHFLENAAYLLQRQQCSEAQTRLQGAYIE